MSEAYKCDKCAAFYDHYAIQIKVLDDAVVEYCVHDNNGNYLDYCPKCLVKAIEESLKIVKDYVHNKNLLKKGYDYVPQSGDLLKT